LTPTIGTAYQARLDSLSTATADVRIRPRIDLTRAGPGRFLTRAAAGRSLAGARVKVQVRRAHSQWHAVRTFELAGDGEVEFLLRGRGRVRVVMSAAEAGPGYVAGFSNALSL